MFFKPTLLLFMVRIVFNLISSGLFSMFNLTTISLQVETITIVFIINVIKVYIYYINVCMVFLTAEEVAVTLTH